MTAIGTIPTYIPSDQAVEAALEWHIDMVARQLATPVERSASELATLRRHENAYMTARLVWRVGIRPDRTEGGAWVLPSRSGGGYHIITRTRGVWGCCCRAGATMHWAIALMVAVEWATEGVL